MSTRNAIRVKDIHGMEQIMIDLKPNRCDSFVYSQVDVDMTNLVKYIEKRKKTGDSITVFHAFVTALGKVIYNRNKLNRFVSNRHVFEHNDVVISFVAKVAFEDKAEEMMIMVPIKENDNIQYQMSAIELIAKIADGGMRDAITLMDKCLSYSEILSVENVINALGIADYDTMLKLTEVVNAKDVKEIITILNNVYSSGIDLRQFIKNYFEFILDANIYSVTGNEDMVKLPDRIIRKLESSLNSEIYFDLLEFLVDLQGKIKWAQNVKAIVISEFMLFVEREK